MSGYPKHRTSLSTYTHTPAHHHCVCTITVRLHVFPPRQHADSASLHHESSSVPQHAETTQLPQTTEHMQQQQLLCSRATAGSEKLKLHTHRLPVCERLKGLRPVLGQRVVHVKADCQDLLHVEGPVAEDAALRGHYGRQDRPGPQGVVSWLWWWGTPIALLGGGPAKTAKTAWDGLLRNMMTVDIVRCQWRMRSARHGARLSTAHVWLCTRCVV